MKKGERGCHGDLAIKMILGILILSCLANIGIISTAGEHAPVVTQAELEENPEDYVGKLITTAGRTTIFAECGEGDAALGIPPGCEIDMWHHSLRTDTEVNYYWVGEMPKDLYDNLRKVENEKTYMGVKGVLKQAQTDEQLLNKDLPRYKFCAEYLVIIEEIEEIKYPEKQIPTETPTIETPAFEAISAVAAITFIIKLLKIKKNKK